MVDVLAVVLPIGVFIGVVFISVLICLRIRAWRVEMLRAPPSEESYITEPIPHWLSQDQIDVLFTKRPLTDSQLAKLYTVLKAAHDKAVPQGGDNPDVEDVDIPSCVICLDCATVTCEVTAPDSTSQTPSERTAVSNDSCPPAGHAPYATDVSATMHPASSCSNTDASSIGGDDESRDSANPSPVAAVVLRGGGPGSTRDSEAGWGGVGGGGVGGGARKGGVGGAADLFPNLCRRNFWCRLPCAHYFHSKCLEVWLVGEMMRRLEPSCPICRTTVLDHLSEPSISAGMITS